MAYELVSPNEVGEAFVSVIQGGGVASVIVSVPVKEVWPQDHLFPAMEAWPVSMSVPV